MSIIKIGTYEDHHKEQIIDLVSKIQAEELGMSITAHEQTDLHDIPNFYMKDAGNFWVATYDNKVIGTIALIDIGNAQGALRKMFVAQNFRGKERNIGQMLLNALVDWCDENKIKEIYLSTLDKCKAAHRFCERNDFEEIHKGALPTNFPVIKMDGKFYRYKIY